MVFLPGRFAFLRAEFCPELEHVVVGLASELWRGGLGGFGLFPRRLLGCERGAEACLAQRRLNAGIIARAAGLEALDDVRREPEADMDLCRFGLRAAHLLEGFHRVDEIGHYFPHWLHFAEVFALEFAYFALFVGERTQLPSHLPPHLPPQFIGSD